jgi:hypothetical protein
MTLFEKSHSIQQLPSAVAGCLRMIVRAVPTVFSADLEVSQMAFHGSLTNKAIFPIIHALENAAVF